MKASKLIDIYHDKDRRAFAALADIYGDDTETVLNALHAISARLAIATGVDPKKFAGGVKHHWDFVAKAINGDEVPARRS